ncbi:MAG: nitronate monooxygenase, partial [Caldimonas sp.]
MNSRLCEMFGIDVPVFAFSHCRDVVVEVSKAGGMGVLGMARMSPERLKEDLKWIDAHIDGRPYGIDVLMPTTYQDAGTLKFDAEHLFPKEHLDFVRDMLDAAAVPPLPAADAETIAKDLVQQFNFTPQESAQMIEIAMQHPIRLIVNALGSPPRELVERAHARGIKVAALAGKEKHAIRHKEAGCDFVIAVGTEAGGHTGSTTSMVLWPRIVDAVAPLPVLGAGGVGRGRQLAAALALGCEG